MEEIGEARSTEVKKAVDPRVDLGSLLLEDQDPFDFPAGGLSETYLLNQTRDNAQYLINEIWKLPTEQAQDAGLVAQLPKPKTLLPREKPIPKAKTPTKWEEYKRTKGFQKRKKSKMLWDEATQTWKPRWGYKRTNDDTKDWMLEVPDNADPYHDYFGERLEKKKERRAKNELQRIKNVVRSQKSSSAAADGIGFTSHSKNTQQLGHQISRAREATASLGKFNEVLPKEKPPRNKGKTHQFTPNEIASKTEKESQLAVLKRLESKRPRINAEKAIGQRQTAMETENRNSKSENPKKSQKKRSGGTGRAKKPVGGNRKSGGGKKQKKGR